MTTRPCKEPTCRRLIQWHVIPGKPTSSGYWVNVDTQTRHLCPNFQDPRALGQNHISSETRQEDDLPSRIFNIERIIAKNSSVLQELKIKIDSLLEARTETNVV